MLDSESICDILTHMMKEGETDKRDVEETMTDEERKALHARMAEWFNG